MKKNYLCSAPLMSTAAPARPAPRPDAPVARDDNIPAIFAFISNENSRHFRDTITIGLCSFAACGDGGGARVGGGGAPLVLFPTTEDPPNKLFDDILEPYRRLPRLLCAEPDGLLSLVLSESRDAAIGPASICARNRDSFATIAPISFLISRASLRSCKYALDRKALLTVAIV